MTKDGSPGNVIGLGAVQTGLTHVVCLLILLLVCCSSFFRQLHPTPSKPPLLSVVTGTEMMKCALLQSPNALTS